MLQQPRDKHVCIHQSLPAGSRKDACRFKITPLKCPQESLSTAAYESSIQGSDIAKKHFICVGIDHVCSATFKRYPCRKQVHFTAGNLCVDSGTTVLKKRVSPVGIAGQAEVVMPPGACLWGKRCCQVWHHPGPVTGRQPAPTGMLARHVLCTCTGRAICRYHSFFKNRDTWISEQLKKQSTKCLGLLGLWFRIRVVGFAIQNAVNRCLGAPYDDNKIEDEAGMVVIYS